MNVAFTMTNLLIYEEIIRIEKYNTDTKLLYRVGCIHMRTR